MLTRHLLRHEWPKAFDRLSRTYAGALVSLEIVGGTVGAEEEIHQQPLRGITADRSGVTIHLGSPRRSHHGRYIPDPHLVRIAETEEGAVVAVEIEQEDGIHTLIQFCSRTLPEMLDRGVE